ncbi:hypothetical protein C8R45DRAFT_164052 [Mycena sanguinolenta]|nr:hypothetical protein C8R45DRAFT_164052 [Mycena sanguinolenta]
MPPKCSVCGAVVISTGDGDAATLSPTTDPQTLARLGMLSDTNEAPREAELSIIRPIVEGTSARLHALDAEIIRLQARLRQLEGEGTILSQYHDKNTRILSPLRGMGPEILGEIFSWTVPSICDVLLSVKNCPWVLTRLPWVESRRTLKTFLVVTNTRRFLHQRALFSGNGYDPDRACSLTRNLLLRGPGP